MNSIEDRKPENSGQQPDTPDAPVSPVPGEPDPYPVTDPLPEPAPEPAPPEPVPQYPPDVTYRVASLKQVNDGEKGNRGDNKPQYQPLQKGPVPEFFNRLM